MKLQTILIAADTYVPTINGAARFTNRLAVDLIRRGYDVHIICPDTTDSGFHTEKDKDGATRHYVSSLPSFIYGDFPIAIPPFIMRQVKKILKTVNPDVIHAQCHYSVGRITVYYAKEFGIRIVGTNHFMPENVLQHVPLLTKFANNWATKFSWEDCGRVFNKCDVVTAPTPRAAGLLESEGHVGKVWPISCGIDTAFYDLHDGEEKIEKNGKTVLFVGRLDSEKNIDLIIQAMRYLDKDVHLNIVGDGIEKKKLEKLVVENKLVERVHFLGKLSDAELRQQYISADVFCMPSTAELQSLATLESMCAATPVVAANAMALPHLVKDGKNGYLFEPGDVEDLTQKLNLVLNASDEERKEMGKVSKELTYSHSLAATVDTFEKLYQGANKP
ncbi:MAG: glycosyltransferase [Micrococcaceae bacterium]